MVIRNKMKNGLVIDEYGNKFWYKNDKRHRDNDLPACECTNGRKMWYVNGECHRDNDLPACEYSNGARFWYINGKLHRDNGLPAIITAHDEQQWFVNGIKQRTPRRKTMKSGTYYVLGLKLTVKKNKILNIE